jgi:hypothetical protein
VPSTDDDAFCNAQGGFNGGGSARGHTGNFGGLPIVHPSGGGGGGASDVRVCATPGNCGLSDRVLVAGGGGGASHTCTPGGSGGGTTGGAGCADTGGQGGTQTAGGASGLGSVGLPYGGDLGQGGQGHSEGSGAGGGGLYGGGGGTFADGANLHSGGGGGSGYCGPNPPVSACATSNLGHTGTGQILITYQAQHTLTVTTDGTGSGYVTSSPAGIDCGRNISGHTDCTELYNESTVVTLTAHRESRTRFAGWSGSCTGKKQTCKVTMSEARNVTATFTSRR